MATATESMGLQMVVKISLDSGVAAKLIGWGMGEMAGYSFITPKPMGLPKSSRHLVT